MIVCTDIGGTDFGDDPSLVHRLVQRLVQRLVHAGVNHLGGLNKKSSTVATACLQRPQHPAS